MEAVDAKGAKLEDAVQILPLPCCEAVNAGAGQQNGGPGQHVPYVGHIAVADGELVMTRISSIENMAAQHPNGIGQPAGLVRLIAFTGTAHGFVLVLPAFPSAQRNTGRFVHRNAKGFGGLKLRQKLGRGVEHLHMIHGRLLPMAAVGQDLQAELRLQGLPGPIGDLTGNKFGIPQPGRTDGGGLQNAPVAQIIFADVAQAHILALLCKRFQDRPGIGIPDEVLSHQMQQQNGPVHAADTRIDGARCIGSLHCDGILFNPVQKKGAELRDIMPFSGQDIGLPELVEKIMAVEHEDPFRISIGTGDPVLQ